MAARRRGALPLLLAFAAVAAGCGAPPPEMQPQLSTPAPTTAPPAVPGPTVTVPPTTGPSPSPAGSTRPVPPPGPAAQRSYVFPVRAKRISYGRTHHDYPATDIFAACKSAVLAVTDGVVLEVSLVDRFDPGRPRGADKGGLSVSVQGADGVRYYGSHLTRVLPGIAAGARVRAGQQLGTVGRTGNASNVCHLHFGISPVCAARADWWIRRGVIWPASYLDAWRKGTPRSPAAQVDRWRRANGCPPAPR